MPRRFTIAASGPGGPKFDIYDPELIDPVALYNFDGDGNDSGPNALHLTHSATPVFGAGFGGGGAWSNRQHWNGSDSTGWLGPSGSLGDPLRLTGSYTIQVWVNYPFTNTGVIVSQGQTIAGPSPANNTLYIIQSNTSRQILVGHENTGGTFRSLTTANKDLLVGGWQHVAVTRDAAGTNLKVYVNAILHGESTVADGPSADDGPDGEFEVGTYNGASPWEGAIAGLLVESVERTAAEIGVNFRRGASGF